MSRYITLPKLAEKSGIPASRLRQWKRDGWLKPSAGFGNRPMFTEEALEEAVELSKGGSPITKQKQQKENYNWAREVLNKQKRSASAATEYGA